MKTREAGVGPVNQRKWWKNQNNNNRNRNDKNKCKNFPE
jgi:hypothetical protein